MFNRSRRKFVKGVAYSSILAIGGLSGLALAGKDKTTANEVLTLINHTASNVTFSGISLAGSYDIYHYLAIKEVKLGKQDSQSIVTIAPGEQLSFVVATQSSNDSTNTNNKNLFITDVLEGHLAIKSDHRQFNGIFPITVFKAKAA